FQEKPEGARPEAATAGRARGISREYQFRGGQRSEPSARRAHHRQARAGAGVQLDHWHHSRWLRAVAAFERRRTARVSRDEEPRETQLYARECVSGQHRSGAPESVALSSRSPLSLYLRGWAGALLLAAARVPCHSTGEVHASRYTPRVPYGKTVRSALHGIVCAPGIGPGRMACTATASARVRACERTGAYRVAVGSQPSVKNLSPPRTQSALRKSFGEKQKAKDRSALRPRRPLR